MPSQIKVDEIKNVAGQYKIKTNVFEGQTTAGSIAVQGEGTNTTNLQQGLTKYWTNLDGTGTITTRDSFNHTSETDHDTGKYTLTLTNAMSNANYAITMSTGGSSSGSGRIFDDDTARTTSAFKVVGQSLDNAAVMDIDNWNFAIHGDLA